MFQKPRLSNAVSHRVFLMAGGHTPGVLSDNRGVSETCPQKHVEKNNARKKSCCRTAKVCGKKEKPKKVRVDTVYFLAIVINQQKKAQKNKNESKIHVPKTSSHRTGQ